MPDDYGPADFIDPSENPFAGASKEGKAKETNEVTIKFGKGLISDTFTTKSDKTMDRIMIPNKDPNDSRPWETFVVPANMVHDNQFGKGVWMKLPEDGTTKLSRSVLEGQDETGKNVWGTATRTVSNIELKSMMESYKTRDRNGEIFAAEEKKDSVLSDLSGKKERSAEEVKDIPKKEHKSKDKGAR